jgi:hypothetical protein
MDISRDITYEYVTRVRYHEDELGTVLKGHLLVEHLIDLMIRKGFKRPTAILNDHRTYSFSVKARILFESGHLPQHIFNNIERLNRIRNQLAHNLTLNEAKIDYHFSRNDKNVDMRPGLRKRNPLKHYLYMLAFGTLSQMQLEFFQRYGTFPLFEQPIEPDIQEGPNNRVQRTRKTRR